jgi:hypothetical protein
MNNIKPGFILMFTVIFFNCLITISQAEYKKMYTASQNTELRDDFNLDGKIITLISNGCILSCDDIVKNGMILQWVKCISVENHEVEGWVQLRHLQNLDP